MLLFFVLFKETIADLLREKRGDEIIRSLCRGQDHVLPPLDEVVVEDCCSSLSSVSDDTINLQYSFTLASTKLEDVQKAFDKWIKPELGFGDTDVFHLPLQNDCLPLGKSRQVGC